MLPSLPFKKKYVIRFSDTFQVTEMDFPWSFSLSLQNDLLKLKLWSVFN